MSEASESEHETDTRPSREASKERSASRESGDSKRKHRKHKKRGSHGKSSKSHSKSRHSKSKSPTPQQIDVEEIAANVFQLWEEKQKAKAANEEKFKKDKKEASTKKKNKIKDRIFAKENKGKAIEKFDDTLNMNTIILSIMVDLFNNQDYFDTMILIAAKEQRRILTDKDDVKDNDKMEYEIDRFDIAETFAIQFMELIDQIYFTIESNLVGYNQEQKEFVLDANDGYIRQLFWIDMMHYLFFKAVMYVFCTFILALTQYTHVHNNNYNNYNYPCTII